MLHILSVPQVKRRDQRRRGFVRASLSVAMVWWCFAASADANPPEAAITSFDAFLDDWRVTTGVQGVTAACRHLSIADQGASGVAGAFGPDLTSESVMYVGSVTKMITAVAVMRLVERGDIHLEDPLAQWYPEYPNADRITLSDLLAMRSGTLDYFAAGSESPIVAEILSDVSRRWSPESLLVRLATLPPAGQPGEHHRYSNTDYILLGTVVEAVTGRSLAEDFAMHQFAPLALSNTQLSSDGLGLPSGMLRGSAPLFGFETASWLEPHAVRGLESLAWAAGAVVSSAQDMARWMDGVFSDEIIGADTRDLMLAADQPDSEYAFGFQRVVTPSGVAIGHAGSLPGFTSLVLHFPGRQLSVSVLSNDEAAEPHLPAVAAQIAGRFCRSEPDR